MRVLLVEDDSSVAKSIEMILKSEGYMVETTDLGEDAYELGKFYDYDIVVLDLMLPDMHGYEVLIKWAGLEPLENSWEPFATLYGLHR